MAKRGFNLWLDVEVVADLQKMADKQGTSLSYLVNHILKAGLDSTGELTKALDGMSLSDLFEVLTAAGHGRKSKKK